MKTSLLRRRNCVLPCLACAAVLGLPAAAVARPAHKQALAEYFGPFLAKKLNDGRTCHLPEEPGVKHSESEKPHNAFGARLAKVKAELKRAGKKTDIPSRLKAIADEDSDSDGVSNLVEILSGHFPGDAKDTPTAAEIDLAKKTMVAFIKHQSESAGRPLAEAKRQG